MNRAAAINRLSAVAGAGHAERQLGPKPDIGFGEGGCQRETQTEAELVVERRPGKADARVPAAHGARKSAGSTGVAFR